MMTRGGQALEQAAVVREADLVVRGAMGYLVAGSLDEVTVVEAKVARAAVAVAEMAADATARTDGALGPRRPALLQNRAPPSVLS